MLAPLQGQVDALYVCLDPLVATNAAHINAVAIAAHLPVMHGVRENASTGGLISYGPSFPAMSRRAAEIVDKILKGPFLLRRILVENGTQRTKAVECRLLTWRSFL